MEKDGHSGTFLKQEILNLIKKKKPECHVWKKNLDGEMEKVKTDAGTAWLAVCCCDRDSILCGYRKSLNILSFPPGSIHDY